MANVARLVGMELRQYEKDGEKKQFCGLHLEYLPDSVQDVKENPDSLEIGQLYELEYEIYKMRGQTMARLAGLNPVEG